MKATTTRRTLAAVVFAVAAGVAGFTASHAASHQAQRPAPTQLSPGGGSAHMVMR